MKPNNILQTIGQTPHVRINRLFPGQHEVWIKLERANPGNSIKDRIALAMIEDAERKGLLKKSSVIIEATSENTGIGLAMVSAVKGYRLILVMPESMSLEPRRLMAIFGAEVVLTPREKSMKGAIEKADELAQTVTDAWIPQQFKNSVNAEVHRRTTAQEILSDFPEGFDYLITGVGTGGHITGVAEILKEKFPRLKAIAVETEEYSVISGGTPGPHTIQGMAKGFIPAILNTEILDGTLSVSKEEAFDYARRMAREEGILVGISTGATLAAISKKLPEIPLPSRILTFNYDTGERYLSIEGLF
ncbi:MAG: cysteine synthase A [Flavobacteriales bacterium Tduv]